MIDDESHVRVAVDRCRTLNQLKLYGIAAALSEQLTQSAALSLPFDDRLSLLVERELCLVTSNSYERPSRCICIATSFATNASTPLI